jgi:hypothetical protein
MPPQIAGQTDWRHIRLLKKGMLEKPPFLGVLSVGGLGVEK